MTVDTFHHHQVILLVWAIYPRRAEYYPVESGGGLQYGLGLYLRGAVAGVGAGNHTRAVRLIVFLVAGAERAQAAHIQESRWHHGRRLQSFDGMSEILVVDAVEVGVDHHFGRAQIVYNPVPFLTFG